MTEKCTDQAGDGARQSPGSLILRMMRFESRSGGVTPHYHDGRGENLSQAQAQTQKGGVETGQVQYEVVEGFMQVTFTDGDEFIVTH